MTNIYVGNLHFDTSEDEIRVLFEQHGAVSRVHLVTDRYSGRSRGFAFVDMENDTQGRTAIGTLNGTELQGRSLTVNEARPREPRRQRDWD